MYSCAFHHFPLKNYDDDDYDDDYDAEEDGQEEDNLLNTVVHVFDAQFLLLFSWIQHVPAVYGDYVFPWWADLIGWMMSFVVAACVPVYAVYALCCLHSGSFLQVRQ